MFILHLVKHFSSLRDGPYVLTHVVFLTSQSARCEDKNRVYVVPCHIEINDMPTFIGGHS